MVTILSDVLNRQKSAILPALKSVSDETRVRILHILSYGDFSVNEIIEILSMGQSRISRHLKILADAGLLKSRREGSWVYYGLVEKNQDFAAELTNLIISYIEDLPSRETDQRNANIVLGKRAERSQEFFNNLGEKWEKVQEEFINSNIYRAKLVDSIPANTNLVLDLGCGPGVMIPYLLERSEKVLAVDSSSVMIEAVKKEYKNDKRVQVEYAHLENLPIKSGTADCVVASMVLHHISDPIKVLNEVARCLSIGGIFSIVDLVKHNQEFMREKYADLWLGFETKILINWLVSSGFEVIVDEEIQTDSVFKIIFIKAKKKEDLNVRNSN
ncbi:ArsR/SmtB family transcription factor [Leptospira sp. GIMC2001]|uniref:ArsR/SmtB family transcription factor n=1 Tax=Leptospira sp. GIMC2001 TaxID=1513297 RepID=UPI00234AA8A1|nr:metalloregulator ArsR/SmtB family transcription factor [Leptospira sp. GIMC2001]WCL47664.1 metalloregulator ArsR/SmtB family transcription factor [Leptospira sp. GIMC2001]